MTETGLNYTKAALEMDRRQESADADPMASSDDVAGDRFRLTALHDVMDPSATLAGLPSQEQLDSLRFAGLPSQEQLDSLRFAGLPSQEQLDRLSEPMDWADEHAKQVAAIGDSPALAQIAEMQRVADNHAKEMATIGGSTILAQIAEMQRAVNRAKAFRVRFTPPV